MWDQKWTRRVSGLALGLTVLLLGACSSVPTQKPEEVVRQRAEQRWAYLIKGASQWPKAYELVEPSYRAVNDFDSWALNFANKVRWKSAEVLSVKCEAEKCTVKLLVTVYLPLSRRANDTISTSVDETWLLAQGQWYYHQQP